MPSRCRPPHEHRPGGIGEGQPGTVDGRGFALAGLAGLAGLARGERRAGVMEPEEAIGEGDELPREPIGRTVPGGGLEGAGVIREESEQGDLGGLAVGTGLGGRIVGLGLGLGLGDDAELAGVPHQGPGAGMGVLNPEEGVVLALGEQMGGVEIGQIMPGGPEQRPTGGIGPEAGEQITPGDRNGPHDRPVTRNNDSPGGIDKPPHHMSDQRGPDLITGPERNRHPGERIPMPVAKPLGKDGPYELSMGGALKGDVEEPRSSDINAGDPGGENKPPPQNLGNTERIPLPLLPLAPLASSRATLVA